jgi:dual specificity phosphatase 12
MAQLEVFHQASFRVSRRDKATRMFYLERAVEEVLSDFISPSYLNYFMLKFLVDGDGSVPETDMFAKFPRTPTDSAPATPGGPRRRIRCKMCR